MVETTVTMDAPTCATQKCQRPLTRLGPPQNCWRCLVCNPIVEVKPTEKPERKYIDVIVTKEMVRDMIKDSGAGIDEERIREIVVDEMANWHIHQPPVTRDEITETIPPSSAAPKPETYMQAAKRMGVATHKPEGGIRKKADVLADMERLGEPPQERKIDAQIPEELRTEE